MKIRKVIGLHAVRECFKIRPKQIKKMILRQSWKNNDALVEFHALAQKFKIPVQELSPNKLDLIAPSHQGILIEVQGGPELEWNELKSRDQVTLLALDGIEDPHNLGAIIRTAWLLEVDAILLPNDRAVGLTPTVAKVASGGVEHLPIINFSNLINPLLELQKDGFWVYGLAEGGDKNIWNLDLPKKIVWVVGSEDNGLKHTIKKHCDELVLIPQADTGSSYNASVAAAIVLAETKRQSSKN